MLRIQGKVPGAVRQHVEILQQSPSQTVTGQRCRIRITREVVRCGSTSLQYGKHYPVLVEPVILNPKDCHEAFRTTTFHYEGQAIRFTPNVGRRVHQYFSHGSVDQDGNCQTESFTTAGQKFERSYERVLVEYQADHLQGRLDTMADQVYFEGIASGFTTGAIQDAAVGTIVWLTTRQECSATVSKVFEGLADVYRTKHGGDLHAIVILHASSTGQTGGFVVRHASRLCGRETYSTQTEGVAITFGSDAGSAFPDVAFNPSLETQWVASSVQRDFLFLTTNLDLFEKLATVQNLICRNERLVLSTQLAIVAGSNNPYALRNHFGPGHRLVKASAGAYVMKCTPVEAVVARYDNCTVQLPVRLEGVNGTVFADPILMTLSHLATVIPCSGTVSSMFYVDGKWLCRTDGDPSACPPPTKLRVHSDGRIDVDEDFGSRLGDGLYSADQLAAHRRFMSMQDAREPINVKMADAAANGGSGRSSLGLPFSAQDTRQLHDMIEGVLWPHLHIFGVSATWAFHILTLVGAAKLLASFVIRLALVFKHRGCGWYIFSAIFEVTATIALLPVMSVIEAGKTLLGHQLACEPEADAPPGEVDPIKEP